MSENLTKEKRPFKARRFFEASRNALIGMGAFSVLFPVLSELDKVFTIDPISFNNLEASGMIGSALILCGLIQHAMLGITKPQTVRRTRLR